MAGGAGKGATFLLKEFMKKGFILLAAAVFFVVCVPVFFGYLENTAAQEASQQPDIQLAPVVDVAGQSDANVAADSQVQGLKRAQESEVGVSSSENFTMRDLGFGNDITLVRENNRSLEIGDIRSELLMSKNQKEYKFVISWKTNKMALSTVEYVKPGGQAKAYVETGYGFNHSVVLAGLEPASTYTYQIKAKDQWDNELSSEKYSMYTSQRSLSVFEMISKEFTGIFGWAMKK